MLLAQADTAGAVDWTVSVDSTINRASARDGIRSCRRSLPVGELAGAQGAWPNHTNLLIEPADHAIGRSRGGLSTKIHQLVDGTGLPVVVLLTPGQAGDSPMFEPLMAHLRIVGTSGRCRTRPDAVLGDKAYSSRAIRAHLRRRRITAVIPEPDDQKRHRLRRGPTGGRPPSFDADHYKARNVIERGFNTIKQWRGLATRYDRLAIVYRGAAVLRAITLWLKRLGDTPWSRWNLRDVGGAALGETHSAASTAASVSGGSKARKARPNEPPWMGRWLPGSAVIRTL